MPWYRCSNKVQFKFVVARSRREAEVFSRYYLGLGAGSTCEPVETPVKNPRVERVRAR